MIQINKLLIQNKHTTNISASSTYKYYTKNKNSILIMIFSSNYDYLIISNINAAIKKKYNRIKIRLMIF